MRKSILILVFLTAIAVSLQGHAEDTNKDLLQGWYVDGELISPQCLPRPFISEDNFESFAGYYKIDANELEEEPGKFFGKPIKDLDYLPDSWAVKVIASLDTCGSDADESIVQENGSVLSGQMPDAEGYTIFDKIDPQECAKLIPNYPVKPEICYAISVIEYMSGTMGHYDNQYIYGLIREKDKNYILPLLSIYEENTATDEERSMPCILKNTEFCGVWDDTRGKDVVITGDKIIHKYYDTTDTCSVMKEARLEDGRPLSLITCDIKSTEPKYDYTTSYLITLLPPMKSKWIDSDSQIIHMLTLEDPDLENSYCSNDTIKKQNCNLPALYKKRKGGGYFVFSR